MTMNQTNRALMLNSISAAATMWQPCAGLPVSASDCLSSLPFYAFSGSLQRLESIEGLTVKDRRHNTNI
jgi:hypothetical protein